jgi:aminoglycoside 3-N-acetyltransferase
LEVDGKFCNFNFDSASTLVHYVERLLNVGYKYDKAFNRRSVLDGKEKEGVLYHLVYDHEKQNNGPDFSKLDKRAKELGLSKIANLGRGQIVVISSRDMLG